MFHRNSGFVESMRPCTVELHQLLEEQNLPVKALLLVKVWQKKIAQLASKTQGWYFTVQSQQKKKPCKTVFDSCKPNMTDPKKLRCIVTLDLPTAFWHCILEESHAQCKTLGNMHGLNFWCSGQKIYLLEMENRAPCEKDCVSSLPHEIIMSW